VYRSTFPVEIARSKVVGKGNSLGLTLPKVVREKLGIEKGHEVSFVIEGDRVYFKNLGTLEEHKELFAREFGEVIRTRKGPDLTPLLKKELEAARKRIEQKLAETK